MDHPGVWSSGYRRIDDTAYKVPWHRHFPLSASEIVSAFVSRYEFDTVVWLPYRQPYRLFGVLVHHLHGGVLTGFCKHIFVAELAREFFVTQPIHHPLGHGLVRLRRFSGFVRKIPIAIGSPCCQRAVAAL